MSPKLERIIEDFSMVEDDLRLELLLDYSRKLPPLPDRLRGTPDRETHRVPECMSPVYLWVEPDGASVRLHVEVADQAPTVKGLLSILVAAYDGAAPEELADVPADLVERLGLASRIRMQRVVGLGGVIGRLRRRARELALST